MPNILENTHSLTRKRVCNMDTEKELLKMLRKLEDYQITLEVLEGLETDDEPRLQIVVSEIKRVRHALLVKFWNKL